MNEDEHGRTPANVTAMTIEDQTVAGEVFVTVERGNGDLVQTLRLTAMECRQLAFMLEQIKAGPVLLPMHVDFVDVTR